MSKGINVRYFEEPVSKSYIDVEKGDVYKTEYGDYGNWVTIVVDEIRQEGTSWAHILGRYVDSGYDFSGYAMIHKGKLEIQIIGKEVTE